MDEQFGFSFSDEDILARQFLEEIWPNTLGTIHWERALIEFAHNNMIEPEKLARAILQTEIPTHVSFIRGIRLKHVLYKILKLK